jgi:hypothetical protein
MCLHLAIAAVDAFMAATFHLHQTPFGSRDRDSEVGDPVEVEIKAMQTKRETRTRPTSNREDPPSYCL